MKNKEVLGLEITSQKLLVCKLLLRYLFITFLHQSEQVYRIFRLRISRNIRLFIFICWVTCAAVIVLISYIISLNSIECLPARPLICCCSFLFLFCRAIQRYFSKSKCDCPLLLSLTVVCYKSKRIILVLRLNIAINCLL